MKKFAITTLAAGALTTAALGLIAPAQAAPSGPASAEDTISRLEDRGLRVVIDRQGVVTPLEQAEVSSVRLDAEDNVAYLTVR